MRHVILATLLAASASIAIAQTPKERLLVPPTNATHFVVVSEAGKHRDEYRWTLPDGSIAYRESILLRGLVFEQDELVKLDASGRPLSVTIRGVTPAGVPAKPSGIAQALARWKTPADGGEAPADKGLYNTF